jgi:hypothetical protein
MNEVDTGEVVVQVNCKLELTVETLLSSFLLIFLFFS